MIFSTYFCIIIVQLKLYPTIRLPIYTSVGFTSEMWLIIICNNQMSLTIHCKSPYNKL